MDSNPAGLPDAATRPGGGRLRKAVLFAALTLAIVVVGVVGAHAFGSGGYPHARASVVTTAAATTRSEGTAHTTLRFEMHADNAVTSMDVDADGFGDVDFAANRSRSVIRMRAALGFGGTFEAIQDGSTLYVREPGIGDKWAEYQPALDGNRGSQSFSRPWEMRDDLAFLDDVSGDVEVIGEDTLDGIAVTHYRTDIGGEKLKHAFEGTMLSSADIEADPTDVWIDGAGRIRKYTFGLLAATPGAYGVAAEVDIEVTFAGFGKPVEIDIPTRDEILSRGGSSTGSSGIDVILGPNP